MKRDMILKVADDLFKFTTVDENTGGPRFVGAAVALKARCGTRASCLQFNGDAAPPRRPHKNRIFIHKKCPKSFSGHHGHKRE